MSGLKIVLACVHATKAIPAAYMGLFRSRQARKRIGSHEGWDSGALDVAQALKRRLKAPLHVFPVGRLLIEPDNYKPTKRWNELTNHLSTKEKAKLLDRYWQPFMDDIERDIRKRNPALLVVSHSFTPVWKGERRHCDIGILYDPKRPLEKKISLAFQKALRERLPGLMIRRNYPYTGYLEGSTGYFREKFSGKKYVGLEIEVNQKHIERKTKTGEAIKRALADSLAELTR